MNKLQQDHLSGVHSVYKPIEAYSEEWVHVQDEAGKFIKAYPKPGTRKRQDLPSLAEQWREDWKKRRKTNEQSPRNR